MDRPACFSGLGPGTSGDRPVTTARCWTARKRPPRRLSVLRERQFDIVIEGLDRIGRELELIGRRLEVLEV